jgi:hypothetical protein
VAELRDEEGAYSPITASADFARSLQGQRTDNLLELSYVDRRRVHNLKYYTWVEQQGRTVEDLNDQWYHQERNFLAVQQQADDVDALIDEFNAATGLMK